MKRIERARLKLRECGLESVLITDELNIRYITDFDVSDAMVLLTVNSAHLLTDFRYYEMALNALSEDFEVVSGGKRGDYIKDILANENISVLGFEGKAVTYEDYLRYKELFSPLELADVKELFFDLRITKTDDEIEKIQKAQDIADTAFAELLKAIKPEMTEIEVAAELEYIMRKLGSEGPAFSTIAVSGDASALPHGVPRPEKLKNGFLTLDFGAKYMGYCSDMTRTVVIGKADDDMKKLYNTVLNAQLSAIEYLREGRDAYIADKVARDIINKDYEGAFGHSLGHGVGLLVHESPALSPRSEGCMLTTGNIVTVEPGIYLFGKYGCRIEDMIAIREDGIHNFTHSTKELIELF